MRWLLLLAACATVKVGKYQLLKETWDVDQTELKQRAAFELKCDEAQLQLTVLAVVYPGGGPNHAKQVGIDGCGHRLVYVASPNGWLLNSSDQLRFRNYRHRPAPHDVLGIP